MLLAEKRGNVEREFMYHGTSSTFIPSILKQGLIPNSGNAVWDDDPNANYSVSSRKTVGGVYLAKNLMTAISAAGMAKKKFGGNQAIICTIFQPKSGLPDEDTIRYMIDSAIYVAMGVTTHELHVQIALAEFLFGKGQQYLKKFKDSLLSRLASHAQEVSFDPRSIKDDELLKMMEAELTRRVVHHIRGTKEDYYKYPYFKEFVHYPEEYNHSKQEIKTIQKFVDNLPSIREAEAAYLKQLDVMTRMFKRMVLATDDFNYTIRTLEPIKYTGRNRILAIVEEAERNKILKIHYGKPPKDFFDQYTSRIGSGYTVEQA